MRRTEQDRKPLILLITLTSPQPPAPPVAAPVEAVEDDRKGEMK